MADLDSFLEELSSSQPVPGGGSVAGLATAMGASLLVMVCNLTIGKKRYAEVSERVEDVARRAMGLRDRARRLADEDEQAYRRVADAMALPRQTDAEKEARRRCLQDALKGAAEPPLDIMQAAVEVVGLARDLVTIGNRSAISDVAAGSLMADAGYRAAHLNVDINLAAVHDDVWVASARQRKLAIQDPGGWNADVQRQALDIIGGESA